MAQPLDYETPATPPRAKKPFWPNRGELVWLCVVTGWFVASNWMQDKGRPLWERTLLLFAMLIVTELTLRLAIGRKS